MLLFSNSRTTAEEVSRTAQPARGSTAALKLLSREFDDATYFNENDSIFTAFAPVDPSALIFDVLHPDAAGDDI